MPKITAARLPFAAAAGSWLSGIFADVIHRRVQRTSNTNVAADAIGIPQPGRAGQKARAEMHQKPPKSVRIAAPPTSPRIRALVNIRIQPSQASFTRLSRIRQCEMVPPIVPWRNGTRDGQPRSMTANTLSDQQITNSMHHRRVTHPRMIVGIQPGKRPFPLLLCRGPRGFRSTVQFADHKSEIT
jgi:hypothetical protein